MPSQTTDSDTRANPRRSAHSTIAILCGVWFCLTGWLWTFLLNLVIAYPIGLLGFCMWLTAYQVNPNDKKNTVAIALLGLGLVSSLVALFLFK